MSYKKNEPHPAKGTARIDKQSRLNSDSINIETKEMVSNSDRENRHEGQGISENTARRDAKAMVFLLNQIRSGVENYEQIYESLKRLHGEPFEKYFRNYLAGKGDST